MVLFIEGIKISTITYLRNQKQPKDNIYPQTLYDWENLLVAK